MEEIVLKALKPGNPARREVRSDLDLNPSLQGVYQLPKDPRAAAVLVPLVQREEGLSVILTQRAEHLPTHKGQVAFPGGKLENFDKDVVDCALRETEEEIGLSRDFVNVIGTLDPYLTSTGFAVTPIVGIIKQAFTLTPDPREVDAVFEVPFEILMSDNGLRQESQVFGGHERYFYAMNWDGFYIWGVTAAILSGFRELVQAAK